ncbi:MAG TPA: NrfD/PsrC family molybdoenzyme membrane anchor subunit [Bryobacteraceae bacterium]|nr:NrfD/PsrC family molybdoenzyme membrane anchor subunit [Bryobacteraceae bacterium]
MKTETDGRVRYAGSIDPVRTDGRDGDTAIATLEGEAAQQEATRADEHLKQIAETKREPEVQARADTTYYGQPMLKAPVWSIDVPIYYFLGGAAGAAMTLGAAIQLVSSQRRKELRRLSAICHWTGIIGSTAGAAFLIHDLGKPSRFLYMLRIFRPTSPMNVGTWILSAAAPSGILTGLLVNRRGLLGKLGEFTGFISGIFGAALAGYTGVLVANTAIPIWHESRQWMPVLFAASGAASAASVVDLFYDNERGRQITRTFGKTARLAEVVASTRVERAASLVPTVGEPFRRRGPAFLWKTAKVLNVASLALSLAPGRSRRKTTTAALLGAAGAFCLRLAIHYLGNASARNPRASFHLQRAGAARIS